MRILLSCYYFSPKRGGEAAVGWKYATGLAALGHDVTVLYGDLAHTLPMKADVDSGMANGEVPGNLHPVHVAPDKIALKIHALHALPGLWFLYYPAYRRWQRLAIEAARRLHQQQPFDLAHQITIIGYREPGLLWQLGIPFFWGPINGAAMLPWGFVHSFGWRGRYQHVMRNLLNALQMRLPGRSRRAASHAAKIWAVTEEDRRMVEDLWGLKAETMIETGATPVTDARPRQRMIEEPLRLVWCGLLEARKSLDLVLKAMATLPDRARCTLDVIGDGSERSHWQQLAQMLGLDNHVHWHGRVAHSTAQELMRQGHVLLHSSVKEGTPHVVLEAMSSGLPVICHDACGMGVAVTSTSGIKVPMRDPATSIDGFRHAILALHDDPGLLTRLSQGAIARSHELTWASTVARIDTAYRNSSF